MDVTTLASQLPTLLALAKPSTPLTNQQMVTILLIVAVSAMLLIRTRRRVREGRNSPQAYSREQLSRLRDEEAVVQDMEQTMVQLQEVSREIQAQIDTRFAKLECCIRDADQRIDRLERLLRRCEGQPTLDVTVGDGQVAPTPASPGNEDPVRQRVFALADAGTSPVDIAQQTGHSTGEIELILALRRTAPANSP